MESDRKLTLPPAVCGNINGTLKIRVDEIYWADRRPKDSYFVRLKWWGSQNHHIFYPEDVSKNFRTDNYQEGVNDVVFNVCTSAGLFEAYLKKCHRLKFHLLTDKGLLLGTAVVGDMDRILALEPYPSYYPVVDKTGKRIADLHIYFELSFLDEREPDSEDELECVSDENLKQNFKLRKETVRRLKQGDEIINSVVVKGQELRKAMVNSVLAPCDMETVEQVIDFKNALTLCDVSRTKSEDAKLMDYLMGKEMTKEEEEEAIKLLHCKSPVFGRSLQERSSTVYTRDFKTCDVEDDEVLACGAYSKIKHKNPLSASVIALIKTNALISINSYRVGLSNLILTSNGLRKIFNTPDYIATHLTGKVPSETQFIFEYHPVMNLGKSWHRPYVLISKSFEGNVVKFNEYAISKLKPGPNPWERIESLIAGSQIKVYWKHSNQKMPSLLGTTSYPSALHAENFSKKIVIPLYTRYKLHVGNLQLRIELGLGMIYGDAIDKYRKDIYSKAHKGFNTKETYKDLCSNKTDLQGDAEEVLEEAKITFCPMSEDEEEKNKQLMVLSKQAVSYMEKTEQKNTKVPLRDAIASLAGKLQENLMAKKFFQTNDNLSQPDKHEDFCQDPSVTKNMDENDRNMADDLSRMTNKTESSDNDNSNELLESLSNINPGCCEYCCCTQKYCQANNKGGKSIQIKKQWETRSKTCSCGNRQALLKESDCKQNLCNEPVLKRKPRVQATKCRQEVEGISKLPECGFTKCKSSQSFSRQNDSQMMVETAESLPAFGTSTSREKPIITSHMYKIDVYSCDAHFFYQKGELEFYLTYDFPVINKKTGKVKFPQKPTCIELDGEPYPQEHCLFTITSLTDQLISLPRDHITFQIWARCFKKQQEHLVAQARFPLKKLVEWEASYIFAHSNSFNPKLKETSDKYFTPLRLFQEPSNLSIGFDIWNLKNLTLEFDYERFCGSWPELLSLKGFDQELYNENSNPGRFFFNSEISELQLGERDESNLKLPAGKQDIGNDTENQLRFVEKERAYISPQLTEEKYRKNDWRNEFREPVITSDPVTGGPKSERFLFEKDQKQLQDDYCSQKPLPHHSLSKDEDHWASKSLEEKHFFEEETNKISDFKPASIPPSFLGDSTLSSLPPDVVFVDIMSEKLSEGNNPFESPKKLKDKKHWKYIESTDLDFISTVDQTVENPNVYPNYANRKTDKNAENLIPVKHKSDIHFYKNHDSHFLDQPRNLIKKQEKHPHILSNKEEDKNVIGQENIKDLNEWLGVQDVLDDPSESMCNKKCIILKSKASDKRNHLFNPTAVGQIEKMSEWEESRLMEEKEHVYKEYHFLHKKYNNPEEFWKKESLSSMNELDDVYDEREKNEILNFQLLESQRISSSNDIPSTSSACKHVKGQLSDCRNNIFVKEKLKSASYYTDQNQEMVNDHNLTCDPTKIKESDDFNKYLPKKRMFTRPRVLQSDGMFDVIRQEESVGYSREKQESHKMKLETDQSVISKSEFEKMGHLLEKYEEEVGNVLNMLQHKRNEKEDLRIYNINQMQNDNTVCQEYSSSQNIVQDHDVHCISIEKAKFLETGKSIQQKSGLLNDTWPGHKKKKNVIDEACTPSTGYIIDSGLSEDVIDLSTPPKQIVNIDTQTTDSNWSLLQMEPFKIPKYFSARVDIGGAINLPSVNSLFKTSQTSNDKLTSYVTFNARVKGEDVVLNTPVICDDLNPVYNTGWKVELPSGMLYKADNELEFNVVLQITDQKQILKATVDLTTLSAGLAYIDGWYFLFNGSRSQGQLKVNVTPLEDIGTFREVWTQEIVRKKEEARHCPTRCGAFSKELLNDQHYAKSLQEKMEELDRLTEKMKKKIENIDSWSDSPPINLLKEVNAAAKRLCTDDELPLRTNKEKKKTCKTSLHLNLSPASSSKSDSTPLRSPIPLIDLTSSPESDGTLNRVLSIADSDGRVNLSESRNSPSKNVMQVETLFEAVPKDSLEAASNSIEKIIQDLRKARLNE
ncbi:uncharacterized protein LOC106672368 isoform X2 [Cimex lectularius]|uniref:C2 domain-containing protein n=1 Tax=Cimex lectularius TaxID=79782 RepID=A0A8I6S963_CIMLE|nr:uncharacterized protein LOC106672368 isoform X2 [Cimex lectularius]